MTLDDACDKVLKLRALASPGSGATADEAATAAQIAQQICAKYNIAPRPPRPPHSSSPYALPGNAAPPQRREDPGRGWPWWQWAARSFGSNASGISGVSDAQARSMALSILATGAYLPPTEMEIIESALNGLLTEYGKVLLDGMYALAF